MGLDKRLLTYNEIYVVGQSQKQRRIQFLLDKMISSH